MITFCTRSSSIPSLVEADERAEHMLAELTAEMAEREGVTEALKASDQMEWVRHMNSIRARAEEVVYSEIICII